ncbi:hypothetical protein HNR60_001800 [Rhodopseudomonas rhenobacensis]|uniref:Uncharacterized protein n=1 Tax=Rhodopseudomonas rhenobacensis TaxID=87461 RepID=A0A7W7Z2Y4_9BRAD|nr:hypothetical protein [Rhodopseudomonas rhenobacensis]
MWVSDLLNVVCWQRRGALAAVLLACSLGGCGTINEKLAAGSGDYVPQWAGGLPADAPPRPGTPKYEAWQKEMARRRAMPAPQRQELEKTDPSGLRQSSDQ